MFILLLVSAVVILSGTLIVTLVYNSRTAPDDNEHPVKDAASMRCQWGVHSYDYDPEGSSIADCACVRCGKKGKWNPYMYT